MSIATTARACFLAPDDPRWASTLAKTPHDLFHLPGYLQVSSGHEGGRPMAVLVEGAEAGLLMPLILRPLAGFGPEVASYVDATSPYGYPSPLFWGDRLAEQLPALLETCWAFLASEKVVSLFLRLNPFLPTGIDELGNQGTVLTHGPTVYIDLRDPESSWRHINEANRNFIQRMYKAGHRMEIDQWDTYDAVIQAYTETMQRLGATSFYFFPRDYFLGLKEQAAPHIHLGTCFSPDGNITGGVVFSEVGGLIQYFLTGSFEAYREASPAKIIIDSLRRWGIERGHHTLHLGGGVGANQDGLFQFKSRFSKCYARFQTFRKIILPDIYGDLARAKGQDPTTDDPFFPIYRKG